MTSLYAVDADVMIQNTEDADVLIAAVLNGRVPISECIRGQRVRLAESGRVLIYLGERYQDEVKWKRGFKTKLDPKITVHIESDPVNPSQPLRKCSYAFLFRHAWAQLIAYHRDGHVCPRASEMEAFKMRPGDVGAVPIGVGEGGVVSGLSSGGISKESKGGASDEPQGVGSPTNPSGTREGKGVYAPRLNRCVNCKSKNLKCEARRPCIRCFKDGTECQSPRKLKSSARLKEERKKHSTEDNVGNRSQAECRSQPNHPIYPTVSSEDGQLSIPTASVSKTHHSGSAGGSPDAEGSASTHVESSRSSIIYDGVPYRYNRQSQKRRNSISQNQLERNSDCDRISKMLKVRALQSDLSGGAFYRGEATVAPSTNEFHLSTSVRSSISGLLQSPQMYRLRPNAPPSHGVAASSRFWRRGDIL